MFHRPAAQEVQMDVKHDLAGGPACVDDDAVARIANVLLLGEVLSDEE